MRWARWTAATLNWVASAKPVWLVILTLVSFAFSALALAVSGRTPVFLIFAVYVAIVILWLLARWSRRDMVDGILFTARYRPLPLTFRYLSEDLQDGPNHHSQWEDRPALVALKVYVSRKTGLQNCYLTLKNAGASQRSILIKGHVGTNTMSRWPTKTSDWFEPRFFWGDVNRSLGRVMFLLVDIRLPADGQRLGWVIESENEAPISGDVPMKRESRLKGVWRELFTPEEVGYPHS